MHTLPMHYARIDAATEREFIEKSLKFLGAHLRFLTKEKDRVILGLCGGSTPKPIYQTIGREQGIDWSKVWILLLDERYVPADHADSNQKMIRETFLRSVAVSEDHQFFPDTTLDLQSCIVNYDLRVRNLLGGDSMDLAIIGMGPDGHITSLFPPLPAEALGDDPAVIHTTTDRFAVHDRISLTLPPLVRTKIPVFLLTGKEKMRVWEDMMSSAEDPVRWPAQAVLKEGRATAILHS